MRLRALGVVLLLVAALVVPVATAFAAAGPVRPQVDDTDGGELEGGEAGTEDSTAGDADSTEGGEGQGGADAESGAGAGEQEGAEEEEGPPWTYQMARMIVVLLVLLALMMGLMYKKLVADRARGV